ncbi:hypothetical protein LU631_14210 [Erwinia tracheiphila]|uniref:hypothetical protein n=1 Tax=Erwinia tracheiphila TaxID=65700 RepID=UPI001910AD25|nr:hypothetical protein [Erwinia tracheiphila]UIA85849.1 hypothetical protein LU604_13080 [Erwinia tracheiphila]UIA90222.1 hypothetical protein LU631_14210 [Erwinia tracheiphila]UIA94371.1 hypothetical protein LU632_12645 [Erwinia tracheiphila]UIA98772.1 hypothetical protein LU633_12420 [Erwinia tracheiphila]
MSVTSYSMSFIALRADDINFSHMLHPKRKAYVISKSASRPKKGVFISGSGVRTIWQ